MDSYDIQENQTDEILDKYRKALLREKYYLQNEGGRKYKVTNGILINSKDGLSTYSFELESELNLPDDIPIKLTVASSNANGSVVVCEGFQIVMVLDRDFGSHIGRAFIGIEPWRLLEALVDKLGEISSENHLAMKIINDGPRLAATNTGEEIPKGQTAAISLAKNNDISVIWGPPGTGKTYTMSEIARDALINNKSVLVVSHSNVSVDGVVKQTVAGIQAAGLSDLLTSGKVFRYGYVRDGELSENTYAVAYNYTLSRNPDLKNRINSLQKEKEKLKRTGEYHSQRGEQVEGELKKLRAEVKRLERAFVDKARFIATTISKVTIDSLFDDRLYDIVMFDEVSMAYVPQVICAASYARERVVLVGDFRQLAPIVQSDKNSILSEDIFSYLGISDKLKIYAHPWLVMLDEQRRMHPKISAFPNKYVYNNLLSDHKSVKDSRAEVVQKIPFKGKALNLINLTGTYCATMKNSDNSRFNVLSAIIVFQTALQAEESGENSIGIISPYAAQTRLIRAMIQDYKKKKDTVIACSTVHQFQGSERNVIIFDVVESYPSSRVGWLMGKDTDSVTRLINVAISRAKGKLIVIANGGFWEKRFGGTKHIFYRLLKHISDNGNEVSVRKKTLQGYIEKLTCSNNITFYSDPYKSAISDLSKDVKNANEKIVISIPDGKLDSKSNGQVYSIVDVAKKNGIHVFCKTCGYEELPDKWKHLAYSSDNANFPLIIIDDKVAWYGLPVSRGQFKDGNSGYVTVCQTVYRLKGEHLIEMIKAFSDFEYILENKQRQQLREKTGIDPNTDRLSAGIKNKKSSTPAGMDSFIRRMEKCSKCGASMSLARGRTGKCYLRCTGCKETALLTPDVANWYIERDHVVCPIHKCRIKAGLGKYGIYIRCDQGHFMKPDEI